MGNRKDHISVRKQRQRKIKSDTVLHILFYCTFYSLFFLIIFILFLPIFIYILLLCFIFLHCPLSGPVLIYISLLILSCIIEYVKNKLTFNLEENQLCSSTAKYHPKIVPVAASCCGCVFQQQGLRDSSK